MKENYKLIAPCLGPKEELTSSRGEPLIFTIAKGYAWKRPVLTVEAYMKWYELFLITGTDGGWLRLESISFDHLEDVAPEGVSPYVDHVPNPLCVRLFAARKSYLLDSLADEVIAGRWQNEVVDGNAMQCDRCEGAGVVPFNRDTDEICRACRGHGVLKPA